MALDATLEDDIFSATQRNIATLYEYWCFLVLVRCLSDICGEPANGSLFTPSPTGLSLVLHQGSKSLMSWVHQQDGRRVAVDLWFNQTFSRADADGVEIGSWASSIRPDASLRIRPLSGRPREALDPYMDTWVHFDAKFRLDLKTSNVTDADPRSTAKRTDLLKMHAYRDLIRRSAGAYVLYPGFGSPQRRTEFHEILPGIGAFPLRPADDGGVTGSSALIEFLRQTLELTSNQASTNERAQFWRREHTQLSGRSVQAVSFLSRPPADGSFSWATPAARSFPGCLANGATTSAVTTASVLSEALTPCSQRTSFFYGRTMKVATPRLSGSLSGPARGDLLCRRPHLRRLSDSPGRKDVSRDSDQSRHVDRGCLGRAG